MSNNGHGFYSDEKRDSEIAQIGASIRKGLPKYGVNRRTRKACVDLCMFCSQPPGNETEFGEMLRHNSVNVHYLCLLLATYVVQMENFPDDHPLGGFTQLSITNEKKNSQKRKCVYCNLGGATIKCSDHRCRAHFHLPCGRENWSFHEFFGSYRSYCNRHVPKAIVHETFQCIETVHGECGICKEDVDDGIKFLHQVIVARCCPNSIFHHECLQLQACTAGKAHFRCPMCRNAELFMTDAIRAGIYLPERDAKWERENLFEDLLVRPGTCSVDLCRCPGGRNFSSTDEVDEDDDDDWQLLICNTCGSKACHIGCTGQLELEANEDEDLIWSCGDCIVYPRRQLITNNANIQNGSANTRALPDKSDEEPTISLSETSNSNEIPVITIEDFDDETTDNDVQSDTMDQVYEILDEESTPCTVTNARLAIDQSFEILDEGFKPATIITLGESATAKRRRSGEETISSYDERAMTVEHLNLSLRRIQSIAASVELIDISDDEIQFLVESKATRPPGQPQKLREVKMAKRQRVYFRN